MDVGIVRISSQNSKSSSNNPLFSGPNRKAEPLAGSNPGRLRTGRLLARVAGLFSGRGFNIESLSVAETLDPTASRITLVTTGDDRVLEQVTKQLNKLVPVIKVTDFKDTQYVERELVLIKVHTDATGRAQVMNIVDIFRGKIIDVGPDTCIIEVTGNPEKIEAILELLRPIGLKEIGRTGKVALFRGDRVFSAAECGGKERAA